ncbi:DUF721 domain-containing protein [candidate division KSB1 bacterium]|nr:DUF721 domain-containing protein [candidate division KSB1 bacterium]
MVQNNFSAINDIIKNIIKKYELEKIVLEGQTVKEWNNVVGTRISKVTKAIKVSDGKLFVQVLNNSWRTELMLLRLEIKKNINNQVGSDFIKDIIFV